MFGPKRERGVLALRDQAFAWMDDYREHLASLGLGFTDDDLLVIADSHLSHPTPAGMDDGPSLGQQASMWRAFAKTVFSRFPEGGIPPDDPRLGARAGLPLVTYAVAARAVGWNPSEELAHRVLRSLGADPACWQPAMDAWTEILTDDMQVATLYGQLYVAAEPLPRRPDTITS